jgi:hypothetical protein
MLCSLKVERGGFLSFFSINVYQEKIKKIQNWILKNGGFYFFFFFLREGTEFLSFIRFIISNVFLSIYFRGVLLVHLYLVDEK